MSPRTGVLLLNLGSPDELSVSAVRRYLKQFLSDPRVIDIAAPARWLLLNGVILRFRPRKTLEAYRQIWGPDGSPLIRHTAELARSLSEALGGQAIVRFAMRYQNPSMASVLETFRTEGVERLVVFPLYPQYASSSTGSCLEELYRRCAEMWNVPSLVVIPPFYDHPGYIESVASITRAHISDLSRFDKVLISFHGLPERHVTKCDVSKEGHCLRAANCCDQIDFRNRYCYRAQSFATARLIAEALGLSPEKYEVGFQSRLGRTPWIKPYTDELLEAYPKQGVKKLAVMVPSFTADCLETLEEINMRGRESFMTHGGEEFEFIPCLNSEPVWVKHVEAMVREYLPVDGDK